MYLRAAKTEAADAGIETDGMADSVSKLRDDILSLTGGKVDLMLDENSFKSTYQVFKELSQVWDDLTDINRANILEKIGGKRNANVTAAIIQNFAQAEKALATSMNSAGSAMAENDKYMDSIEGRVKKFQGVWQSFSNDFFSGNFIKGVVSGATTVTTGLDAIMSKIGAIPTLIGTITAAMSGWRLKQGGRTGIFDIITNPNGSTSVRMFNNDLKELGTTIKDVYKSYYNPREGAGMMGKAMAGTKAGLQGTFGMISAGLLGRNGQIREYTQLAKEYNNAKKAYEPFRGKTGDAADVQRRGFKNAANALVAYNTQLKNSSSLWAQYANSVNKTAVSTNATFAGFTKWLTQNNKMGEAFVGTFTKGLASVGSMFGSAFLSAGISMAVMGVISLIGKLINHQEELRQKTRDSALEFNQSQKSISDYASEIAQINTSLDSGDLSVDETIAARERLMAIQNELVSSYGSEASGLNLIAMSATEAAAAMERLQKAEANRFLNDRDNQKGFDQARQAMETSGTNEFYGIGGKDTPKSIVNQLKSLSKEFDAFSFDDLGNGAITLRVTADPQEAVEQIDAFMAEADARGIDLGKIVIGDGRTLNEALVNARKDRQKNIDEYGEISESAVQAEIAANDKYLGIQNDIMAAKDGLSNAINKTYNSEAERAQAVSDAIQAVYSTQDKLNKTDFSTDWGKGVKKNLTGQMDDVMSMIGEEEFKADIELNIKDESVRDSIDNIKSSFDDLSKDAPDKMKNLLSAVKQFQSDSGEIKVSDILDGQKTNAAGWERLSAAAKDYGVSVEFVLQKLAEAHVIQSDSTDLAYNASERFKDLSSTTNSLIESQQLLNSVYSEQSQKGTLSLKTYEALTKEHKEFGSMLEAEGSSIKFNADAAQELIDARAKENIVALQREKIDDLTRYQQNKDAIDELEKSTKRLTETEQQARDAKIARLKAENEDIESVVAKTNIQIAQLESLTSAYSKWQVAQQTANQDAMYNDMLSAKKQIEEGLKNGMIGTDDFKTAVRMLIPDAPDPSDYKAIDSYMKKLNRYLTTDSEGNVTRTGMQNFLTDAVSKSLDGGPLMELKDGYYKVLDGIKPEDFVERLKITPSMAQAIFANLEAHGYEFDWTAEDFFHLENLEEAKNKINEVKEAFNEIDQNKDYTSEGRAQAIHDLAESEKESIKGFVDTYQAAINEMNLYEPGTQSFQDAHDRAEDLMNVIKELPPEILMELGIDTENLDDLLDPERMADPIEVQADVTDAESNIEQVGETYNTMKDGIESSPITTPAPQTEPFDSGIDGVVAKAGTARDLVEGTPMKLPTPYADSFNDGITQGENRFFSMKDVVENSPIKLPTPEVQDTDTPEITVESNVEPFDSGITQAETRFYSTKDLIEGTPININKGEPPEIPQPKDLPSIEMPVDTGPAEAKIKSVRELMGLPIEVPPPNTGAAEGAIGKLEQRVAEIKKKLGSGEATNADTKITVDADTTAAKAKIVALGNTPVKVPIEADPTGIQNAVQSGANGPIRVDVDANVAQAKQQIASLNNMVINVDVQARVANAQNQINGMTGPQIDSTNVSVNYTPNLNALPESFNPITRMVNYIAQLAALPSSLPAITRIVNYVPRGDTGGGHSVNGTANVSGTAHASGTANASGNWGTAPGGTTLVGELGEELVVDVNSGRWYTVGTNGAEFTNIAPGSIVFNHKQTEALFKYGKVAGRGRALAEGTAFAEGTALAGGPEWTIFGTSGSTSSSSDKKKKKQQQQQQQRQQKQRQRKQTTVTADAEVDVEVDVRLNDKDLEKKLEKQLSEMSDKLEYILGQYEHKIFLIEKHAINGFTEEDTRNVIAIYKKMMDEVHAQADKARAKGLSDNSKTITELSKKWFEYRDAITEAITDYYEGLISQTQNAVKLLDFQTGELQNKFHNRTEMVYKQVDAVSTATKEVADELQKLGQGGSVNLLKRPVIDASILRDVGWDDAGEGKATVFSSTFSNEAGTKAINFTPIIVDENGRFVDALEPDALWDYAEDVIAGTREDDLHLQIGAEFNGEDAIQQAELAAERVHELHEKYFLPPPKRTISYWEFSDDGNYDAILETLDEVIEKQREIQRVAHEGADEMRASGKGETSEEIRKFKDDWEDASEAIVQAIKTAYDAITGDLESRITLTENWLDNATKGIGNGGKADFDKVKKYSDDIYDYYTQMQTAIHDEADRLRALGYSDTSEEVSKLSDLWWDYEEKRKTAAINAWKEIVDTAKDATDEIAGMYDTLKQAAKEYSSMGGYLTLDTLEKLLAMEPKYMQMLKDENGLWVIDEENVKKATAAKMEDLAITNALAYVDRLRLALESKSTEQLNELLWVTQDAADSTWQLVYAQLAMLDLSDDQYDAALHNINAIRSMAHAAIEGIGKESDEYKKNLQDMKDGLDDLIKYVMDMLKHKIDEQVDSLEDMKDKYGDIIDEKKKSLDLTKKENDYQKSLGKKVKELAKIQAQIESLRFDTSREAQAKIAKLEQDRADLQEEIAEDQADRAQELTEKALDENLKAYEDEKDDEIEVLKKSISSEEKLYRLATDYMQNHWSTLYGELIDWNTEYGLKDWPLSMVTC